MSDVSFDYAFGESLAAALKINHDNQESPNGFFTLLQCISMCGVCQEWREEVIACLNAVYEDDELAVGFLLKVGKEASPIEQHLSVSVQAEFVAALLMLEADVPEELREHIDSIDDRLEPEVYLQAHLERMMTANLEEKLMFSPRVMLKLCMCVEERLRVKKMAFRLAQIRRRDPGLYQQIQAAR